MYKFIKLYNTVWTKYICPLVLFDNYILIYENSKQICRNWLRKFYTSLQKQMKWKNFTVRRYNVCCWEHILFVLFTNKGLMVSKFIKFTPFTILEGELWKFYCMYLSSKNFYRKHFGRFLLYKKTCFCKFNVHNRYF